ncbi:MAG: IPTL-CTERM sorting domain-containing protein [Bacteroidota bacterium]
MFTFLLKRRVTQFCLFVLFSIFSTVAFAQQPGDAWGYVCGFTVGNLQQGNLYQFDKANGAETLIGTPNCGTIRLFTGEFIDGTYYMMDNDNGRLVSIAADGTCTNIGASTFNGTVSGLSHDVTTGITYLMSIVIGQTSLYTINISTGETTLVGTNSGTGISLVIDGKGNAYQIGLNNDQVNTIDLATAAVTPGPAITRNGNPVNLNFAQDIDADCDDATGELIGIIYEGGGTGRLGTIDPSTGVFTERAFVGSEVCGFSVNNNVPVAQAPIPTMSQWGLMIFGLLIVNMSVVLIRRREIA